MHADAREGGFGRRHARRLFAHADHFAGEGAGFGAGLRGLRGIALGAFGGLQDVGFGFGFEGFEVGLVAVEFALVAA